MNPPASQNTYTSKAHSSTEKWINHQTGIQNSFLASYITQQIKSTAKITLKANMEHISWLQLKWISPPTWVWSKNTFLNSFLIPRLYFPNIWIAKKTKSLLQFHKTLLLIRPIIYFSIFFFLLKHASPWGKWKRIKFTRNSPTLQTQQHQLNLSSKISLK